MRYSIFRAILAVMMPLNSLFALCQTSSEQKILLQFDERFNELDAMIYGADAGKITIDNTALYAVDTISFYLLDSTVNATIEEKKEAEISAFRGKTGLVVTGSAYYRFFDAFGSDDDDVSSYYNSKMSAELRWSPFQSAVFKRKGRINEIQIQNRLDHIAYEKDRMAISSVGQKEFFQQYYDSLQSGVLQHRIDNLALMKQVYDYLLQNENITGDELLNILNDKAEAERKLMALGKRYPKADILSCNVNTVIRVDTVRFLQSVRDNRLEMKELGLKIELLEQKEKNISYWSDADVAPFVRYSYYTRPATPNSHSLDAGVSFRFPINSVAKRERRVVRSEREMLVNEQTILQSRVEEDIVYVLDEIDRLNYSIIGEVKRCKELLEYLNIRKKAYENRIGEYNRLARMKEYNGYLTCLEKIFDYCYRRDCQIVNLSRYLVSDSMASFLYVEEIKDDN